MSFHLIILQKSTPRLHRTIKYMDAVTNLKRKKNLGWFDDARKHILQGFNICLPMYHATYTFNLIRKACRAITFSSSFFRR